MAGMTLRRHLSRGQRHGRQRRRRSDLAAGAGWYQSQRRLGDGSQPAAREGGTDPETAGGGQAVRAPRAFRKRLERAITADDYREIAAAQPQGAVRAARRSTWTGSWYEADVAIDPLGGEERSGDGAGGDRLRARAVPPDGSRPGGAARPAMCRSTSQLEVCALPHYQPGTCQGRAARTRSAPGSARRQAGLLPPRQSHVRRGHLSERASSPRRRRCRVWSA